MRRFLALMLAALCLTGAAPAEVSFDGSVVCANEVSLAAPFGGVIASMSVRAGDRVEAGDVVATVQTTKVYAASDRKSVV